MEDSEKKVIAESEISNDGVGHSDAKSELGGASASPKELEMALVAANTTIQQMKTELETLKAEKKASSSDDSINKLASMLASAISTPAPRPVVPAEADNINRTQGFAERQNMDGASLMEAQSKMMAFKDEPKHPISVAKTFQAQFGPYLPITVNGVRVSIPCDGKTYYINETHYLHARERIAKVDRMLSDTSPQITEVNA